MGTKLSLYDRTDSITTNPLYSRVVRFRDQYKNLFNLREAVIDPFVRDVGKPDSKYANDRNWRSNDTVIQGFQFVRSPYQSDGGYNDGIIRITGVYLDTARNVLSGGLAPVLVEFRRSGPCLGKRCDPGEYDNKFYDQVGNRNPSTPAAKINVVPPGRGFFLEDIDSRYSYKGVNWVVFRYKNYITGETKLVDVSGPPTDYVLGPFGVRIPATEAMRTVMTESGPRRNFLGYTPYGLLEIDGQSDEVRRTFTTAGGRGPITNVIIRYYDNSEFGVIAFDTIQSYDWSAFIDTQFGKGADGKIGFLTNNTVKDTSYNVETMNSNIFSYERGAIFNPFITKYCVENDDPVCDCISPDTVPATRPVGLEAALARAVGSGLPITGEQPIGCKSKTCNTAISSRIATYITTFPMGIESKNCGSIENLNYCATNFNVIGGSGQISAGQLQNYCQFTSSPPQCQVPSPPAACDYWKTQQPPAPGPPTPGPPTPGPPTPGPPTPGPPVPGPPTPGPRPPVPPTPGPTPPVDPTTPPVPELTFWDKYKWYIIVGIALVIIAVVAILFTRGGSSPSRATRSAGDVGTELTSLAPRR